MGYYNIFAREQLLASARELTEELGKIEFTKEDDALDVELKHGAQGALVFAINAIYERIERLKNERK